MAAVTFVMIGACVLHAAPASLTVDVDKPGVKISPTLWGIFFEDINLSADGGIYPELVRNRSFEDSDQPDHWTLTKADGDKSEMAIDSSRPLDPMNRRSLRVEVDGSATLVNEGYWGMAWSRARGTRCVWPPGPPTASRARSPCPCRRRTAAISPRARSPA